MAGYAFETMSQADAASFDGTQDYLFFITQGASAASVNAVSTDPGFGGSATQLSYGGKTLTFPAAALSTASTSGHIQFNDNSHLVVGTGAADTGAGALTLANPTDPSTAPGSAAFGLGGSDTINGNNGNNYLYGGNDSTTSTQASASVATATYNGDTITAGSGNNHIYGNSLTTQQGATDGNDSITAGGGTNYINGNGGADRIIVGTAAVAGAGGAPASTGANHVLGGGGNDFITVQGGGANLVNGNLGNDSITAATATFNNTLRGGQGSDTVVAGTGQDRLYGDLGTDSLVAGTGAAGASGSANYGHLTIMTGGDGNDVFDFSGTTAGNAGQVTTGQNATHTGVLVSGGSTFTYQTITDFTQGQDTIHLPFTVSSDDIVHAQSGVTFSSVAAAEVYANQILANNTPTAAAGGATAGEVAALDVNGNTYLFYNSAGDTTNAAHIDSIIQLTGVQSNVLSQGGAQNPTFS